MLGLRPNVFLLIIALTGVACPGRRGAAPLEAAGTTRKVATLERRGCFGTCPFYRLAVFGDGRVEFDGRGFVKASGHQVGQLTAGELDELRRAFEAAHYFSLHDRYMVGGGGDLGSMVTSYCEGDRCKQVMHCYGDNEAPPTLTKLEDRIDEIVHSGRWVGTSDERWALRKAEMAASAHADAGTRPPQGTMNRVAAISESNCRGGCWHYSLTVYEDGREEYEGAGAGMWAGPGLLWLSPLVLDDLRKAFREAGYFSLRKRYHDLAQGRSAPSTTYCEGLRCKSVEHRPGRERAPPALTQLERRVPRLLLLGAWITSVDRLKALIQLP